MGGGITTVRNILRVIFVATYLAVVAARACTTGKESAGGKVFADGVCDGGEDGDKESKSGESE
jgi:hypothetical protein